MSKRYDATLRTLIDMGPAGWHRFLRIRVVDPVRVWAIDSNVSTVTAEADKVLWVDGPVPWIEHIELQASRDLRLAERGLKYSTLLRDRHQVPVRTVLVLLRPEADGPELNGRLKLRWAEGDIYVFFRYDVVRIWELPVQELLTAGLSVIPLAPVSNVEPEKVPEVLIAIANRLIAETSPEQGATLWAATKVLMGLRFQEEHVEEMIEGVSTMILGIRGIEESTVYQGIFAKGRTEGRLEGRLDEAREIMLRQGRKRFGDPAEGVRMRIAEIDDVDRLNSLLDRLLDVASWDELLNLPDPVV